MHNHTECDHELKYCKQCDVVYCEKCGGEWKKFFSVIQNWKPYVNPPFEGYRKEGTGDWPGTTPMMTSYPVKAEGHVCPMPGI
jgi:hypothetical protein